MATKTSTTKTSTVKAPAPTKVVTPKIAVPTYGSEVKDSAGKVVGVAKFDPNTGDALKAPKAPVVNTPKPITPRAVYDKEPTVFKARSEDDIQKDMLRSAQGEISGLNKYYDSLISESKVLGEKNMRSTDSISVLTGLQGSTEATGAASATGKANNAELSKIENERSMAVQSLMGNIRRSSVEAAKNEREEARLSEQDRISFREKSQGEAVANLTNLAASGVTFEGLKTSDPKSYEYLAKSVGGEEQMKAMFTLNRPQDTILDKKVEGGKYIITYQNPLTGAVKIETVDLGLPAEYTKTVDAGDRILAVPSDWDGDPSKLITINKGLTPAQKSSGTGTGGGGSGGGKFSSDLDLIYNTVRTGKNSKTVELLDNAYSRARNDTDRINILSQNVSLPADVKSDLIKRSTAVPLLDSAVQLLDDGVKTGYFKGLGEKVANKFGQTTDPQMNKIKQYIVSAIQPYRNSVTGAAWGSQEEAEYQALFGSTLDNPEFLKSKLTNLRELMLKSNIATISSGLSLLDPTMAGQYMPGGQNTGSTTTSPAGEIRVKAGVQYRKQPDGSWKKI